MELVNITDPFTGQRFAAMRTDNGNIIIPDTFSGTITLTNELVLHNMDGSVTSYSTLSMTQADAAKALGVTKARVSKLLNNDQLQGFTCETRTAILSASVDSYMKGRQNDRRSDSMADGHSD